MKRWLILLLVGCLVLGSVASAAVQKGDTEIDALGAWMKQNAKGDAEDIDVFFLSAGIGYFVTDNIQIQGAAVGAWTEVAGVDTDIWAIGARAKYHFMPTNQWVPYIGGQLMWANFDAEGEDGDGVLWGPLVGLRYELNAYNDFFVEYQYHMWDGDIRDYVKDGHGVFVGIVHQFK
ncbi:outer membrane beta-barrel protein [Anaerobaca lacustris]|uniref:Outer membrane beta-barrel protein n=1 Tax=Anaerobaca lacustris TaxID=3044600 RepID=A0AAW6TVA6_9BACT|nr:outer membrane beta-barrel protein [Sedimentisphaerales bacterium M17dextr]